MHFSEISLLEHFKFQSVFPVLVDVGAHHGHFSGHFNDHGWQIVAFEPEQSNYAIFQNNLARFESVICIRKAVSNTTGDLVSFFVSDKYHGIHSLQPFHKTHRLAYKVETVRLDDALTELMVSEVTLLKIDTEGADFLALKGFDFEKFHPELVMVEFMDDRSLSHFGYTHHDMVAYMSKRGYTAFISEWAPIKEYARKGQKGEPHVWIQCKPYPLGHEPAWGNIFFIPQGNESIFERSLEIYLSKLNIVGKISRLKTCIEKLPQGHKLYRIATRLILSI